MYQCGPKEDMVSLCFRVKTSVLDSEKIKKIRALTSLSKERTVENDEIKAKIATLI